MAKTLNILVVCQHYWPEPFNINETCEMLSQRGHNVTVLTGLPNYPQGYILSTYKENRVRKEVHNEVQIRRTWIVPRGKDLAGINKLKRVANYLSFPFTASLKNSIIDVDFDVVLAMQFSPILMAVPAIKHAHRKGKACLIYVFDLWPEDLLTGGMKRGGISYKIMKLVSRIIYSKADAIAITSPDFEKYFVEELGLKTGVYRYLPQYAEEQFEALGAAPTTSAKQKDTVDIVFAGNVGGNQAVDNIVRAAALIEKKSNICVHIYGSGSKLEECISLASRLQVENVIFHGRKPIDSMPEYYEKADAMLLTLSGSNNGSLVPEYTIPRRFQSYLAAGKPIIAAANGVVSRLIKESDCGICCEADNPRELAQTIRRFAQLPKSKRIEMGLRARQVYSNEFARNLFIKKMEELLLKLGKN